MELTFNKNSLSPQGAEELAQHLDQLLADYQVYHEQIKDLKWNQRLRPYFRFNRSLGILYRTTDHTTDVIADQIMSLGFEPSHGPSQYLMKSRLSRVEDVEDFDEAIKALTQRSKELLFTVKEVFDKAAELEEEETLNLMSQLAQQVGMNIWYFSQLRMATLN